MPSAGHDLFQSMFEQNQMAIAIVNMRDLEVHKANRSFGKLLEIDDKSLCKFSLVPFLVAGDTQVQFAKEMEKLRTGEVQSFTLEHRYQVKNGKILDAVTNGDMLNQDQAVIVVQDITDRIQQEIRATQLANYDELTKLPNRRMFTSELERQVEIALNEETSSLGVMFLDLDGFKEINDTLGHEAGDELLVEVAKRLRKALRKGDFISRLAGDEFAVINPNSNSFNTAETAQRLIDAISQPVSIGGFPVTCSVSIGLSAFPEDGDNGPELLRRADIAMYEAKRNRKGFSCFSAEDNKRIRDRVLLRNDLERALSENSNEIQVYYQPRIDLSNNSIKVVEALARWRHPERGFVSPELFISIAEETTLIHNFGKRILEKVCKQLKTWHDQGLELRVAFNLAAKELERFDIYQQIETALSRHGVQGKWLEVEINETASMKDIDRSVRFMSKLKTLGVHLAIDDFGTGYSSLTALKQLPADTIKIDQEFIQLLVEDVDFCSPDADIVKAIVTLADSFHMSTVAEGVETQAQAEYLTQLGCEFAQGYYYNPPMPPAAIEELVRDHS